MTPRKSAARKTAAGRSLQFSPRAGGHHLLGALHRLDRGDPEIVADGKEPEAVAAGAVGLNADMDLRGTCDVHVAGKFLRPAREHHVGPSQRSFQLTGRGLGGGLYEDGNGIAME